MDCNKANNNKTKKNKMKIRKEDIQNIQRGKKKKAYNENMINKNYEKDECFSEQVNENIYLFNDKKGKIINNSILSPAKPDKNKKKDFINKEFHSEARMSVPKSLLQRKKNYENTNFKNEIINDISIQINNNEYDSNFSKKGRSNTHKKITEFNQQEIKNTKQNNMTQKSQNKDKAKSKCASQRRRKSSKNVQTNMRCINNEKKEKIKEKENKLRKTRSSYPTRKNQKKIIDDTNINISIKNKEIKKNEKEKNKGKKEKRKRGIKEHKKNETNNNNYRMAKSKSHMSNSTRDKSMEIEKFENPKPKDDKIQEKKKRDYSSPKNLISKNYIDNSLFIKESITGENYYKTKKCISPCKINSRRDININKINTKKLLLKNYIYSDPEVDLENFIITLKKNKIKNNTNLQKKKDILKNKQVNKDVNILGRKRNRAPSIKSKNIKKEKDNNDTLSNYKKFKTEETKDKKIKKGKSQKNSIKIEKDELDENDYNNVAKLKQGLNCDKYKGKIKTRKHKSLKKGQKQKEFVQIKEELLNSVASFSEPDHEVNNYRNNNNKMNNYNNAQNNQFPHELTPSYLSAKNNSLPYTTRNSNDINFPTSLINKNSNIQSQNNNSIKNNNKYHSNTKPFHFNFDSQINNNNMLSSNSVKDLPSETANFMEVNNSHNSVDYSFPIDFEEKIDIKEDKTYYTKTSKYIKYCPIDEYLQPISIQDKKPYRSRVMINTTQKLEFPKKKENKSNLIDNDNDKTDITSSNNDYTYDLPSILKIPRIKPYREEHSKMIKDKLNQDGIKIYQTDNDILLREELNLYAGSFTLYDEKNNIKVTVPCYKENERTKEFMNKKKVSVIEFQEDNDIDTDEEQLELEIERNNNALLNFMKKVNSTKNYVEKSLMRKKKV